MLVLLGLYVHTRNAILESQAWPCCESLVAMRQEVILVVVRILSNREEALKVQWHNLGDGQNGSLETLTIVLRR